MNMVKAVYKLFTPLVISLLFLFVSTNLISAQTLPITSTFVAGDMNFSNDIEYQNMINEMKATGIDTIIIPVADVACDVSGYKDYYFFEMAGRAEPSIILYALRSGVKVFFGLQTYNRYNCLDPISGTPDDPNTDMGHIISSGLTAIDKTKSFLTSNSVAWDDPLLGGFYIAQEFSTADLISNPAVFNFYRDYSQRIKLKEPNKMIMLSQFQREDTDYLNSFNAFKKIYSNTSIDILAPQDSMGSGLTYTSATSKEHYRALHDALVSSGKSKQAWANIEIFQSRLLDSQGRTLPAPVTRVVQQINAAKPYVSKMTTWIYQYSLLTTEASRNSYDPAKPWTIMYTPDLYDLRKIFRNDYLAAYGASLATPTPVSTTPTCIKMYYCENTNYTCQTTSSTYEPATKFQCGTTISCESNLSSYLPGKTTGACFSSLSDCTASCKPPTFAQSDLNKDGKVDNLDYQLFVLDFGKTTATADINGDGIVNIFDYNIMVDEYGK